MGGRRSAGGGEGVRRQPQPLRPSRALTAPCSRTMSSTSASPSDTTARFMRALSASTSHGPYLGCIGVMFCSSHPRLPRMRAVISRAPIPWWSMSVTDVSEPMFFSSSASVSSEANGRT